MDVELAALAGEGGGQVETEAVDVHLGHPVPQRVEDQAQRSRMADVEAVAGTRGVEVMRPVVPRPAGSRPGCLCLSATG